jgi:hypothetical protein
MTTFVVTLLLAVLKILETFPRPKLNVNVTRDIFFRLADYGEALFCNAVLLASNGPVLILDVIPTLKRLRGTDHVQRAEKTFPLYVLNHGEKVRGTQLIAENHFFGSSPLFYLASNSPLRAVYLCLQKEYAESQRLAVDAFVSEIQKFRIENNSADLSDPNVTATILADLTTRTEKHYHAIINLMELEVGDYELQLVVKYESPQRWIWKEKKTASSRIRFSVDQILLDNLKTGLRSTLLTRGQQIVTDSTPQWSYPELVPTKIIEYTESSH